jgi:hypothetical protein
MNISNNVIEKISIDHMTNTSTHILSPNKIHEKFDVQIKRQEKNNNKKIICQLKMFPFF